LLPLLAVELIWPAAHNRPALGRRSLAWLLSLLGLSISLGYFVLAWPNVDQNSAARFDPVALALFAGLAGLCISLALRSAAQQAHPAAGTAEGLDPLTAFYALRLSRGRLGFRRGVASRAALSPRALGWLTGIGLPLACYFIQGIFKDILKQPAQVTLFATLLLLAAALLLANRLGGRLDSRHRYALLFGSQCAWACVGLVAPLDNGWLADDAASWPLISLLALAGLGVLRYALLRRERNAAPPPSDPPEVQPAGPRLEPSAGLPASGASSLA
jgi:hypothetical protein